MKRKKKDQIQKHQQQAIWKQCDVNEQNLEPNI